MQPLQEFHIIAIQIQVNWTLECIPTKIDNLTHQHNSSAQLQDIDEASEKNEPWW